MAIKSSSLFKIVAGVCALFFLGQVLFMMQPKYSLDDAIHGYEIGKDTHEISTPQRESQPVSYPDQKIREKGEPNGPSDGTFNSFPIYHKKYTKGFHSNSHCIGENFRQDAWKYRSCQFQNLCFDTSSMKFVLFASQEQYELEKALKHEHLTDFSPASSMNTTLSVGAINPKWGKEHELLEWYPELRPVEEIANTGYYQLQTDKVLIPWHSMAGFNPGHLVWDDFLPLHTLLTSFDLLQKELVLIRFDLTLAQWASCQRQYSKCAPILKKFLPLIGTQLDKTTNQNETALVLKGEQRSKYICAPNGAAGLGMLSDHGLKLHGWSPNDYEYAYNIGRGGQMIQFRNWMMANLGVQQPRKINSPPYRIIVSVGSSKSPNRNVSFKKHIELLKEKLGGKYEMDIMPVQFKTMTMKEQLELVSEASLFITMCGGGAVTAMFLPKGASLIAYFNEKDGHGGTPARLDWDLLNNLGYLRVHWLPRPQESIAAARRHRNPPPGQHDYDAFIKLVDHELDVISHNNDY